MKKLTKLFSLSLLAFLAGSCEDDLPVMVVPETPIVFAILDKTDSLHYVKITHSFGGYNNAVEVAQIPDSSYYSELDVKVEEWLPLSSDYSTMQKTRTWTLRDTVLNGKAPGTFYGPAQKVYYFKTDAYDISSIPQDYDSDPTVALKQLALYRLVAVANGGEYTITSETRLLENFSIVSPGPNVALAFNISNNDFTTYSTGKVTVGYSTGDYSAGIVNASVSVFFDEYFNGTPVENSYTMDLGSQYTESTQTIFGIPGKTFYEKLKAAATNDPTINKRQLSRIQVTVTAASKTLAYYIKLGAPNSSLEHGEDFYSNVKTSDGRRAIGVFASGLKQTYTKLDWNPNTPTYRAITNASVKALCNGPVTGNLLFCSDNPLDADESYSCQ